jgi:hypothetical protein
VINEVISEVILKEILTHIFHKWLHVNMTPLYLLVAELYTIMAVSLYYVKKDKITVVYCSVEIRSE